MCNENAKYQTKDSYILRSVADSDILISVGDNIANFNGYIELNQSAACLWKAMKEPKTVCELAAELEKAFGLSHEEALSDVQDFLKELTENNMVCIG